MEKEQIDNIIEFIKDSLSFSDDKRVIQELEECRIILTRNMEKTKGVR
jgi:hypothetical protein